MVTIQTAIATIDREVMQDIASTQFMAHGFSREILTTTYKGVPLYLMHCDNGIDYVCTRAQMQYFVIKLANKLNTVFHFREDRGAFRVYPKLNNLQHKDKGAQYGTTYTSIAKSHGYSGCLHI